MFREDLYLSVLKTKTLGRTFRYIKEVSSTNDVLLDGACVSGEALIADTQTKGRGRSGRSWFTSGGALAFSVVLPISEPSLLMPINIIAGYSVSDALKIYAPIKVKWPNDCVINGGKVCGMLLDTRFKGKFLEKAVLGIGVNLAAAKFPTWAAQGVCVKECFNGELHREIIMAEILNNIEKYLDGLILGTLDVAALWQSYSANINKEITLHRDEGVSKFIEKGIDSSGCLIVSHADGTEEIITCGDVGYDFSR